MSSTRVGSQIIGECRASAQKTEATGHKRRWPRGSTSSKEPLAPLLLPSQKARLGHPCSWLCAMALGALHARPCPATSGRQNRSIGECWERRLANELPREVSRDSGNQTIRVKKMRARNQMQPSGKHPGQRVPGSRTASNIKTCAEYIICG